MGLGGTIRLAAIAAAAVVGGGVWILYSFNQFAPVADEFAGACTPVTGLAGPEDLQIDPVTRLAFVSSFDRLEREERGGVFAVPIDDVLSGDAFRDRTGGAPDMFEPLGLYLYRDRDHARLFVVNSAGKTVELYDVEPDGDLVWLERFAERRLTSPNDVVAVGPRAFYVTNDIEPGRSTILGKMQFLLRSGSGRLLHFDGTSWRVAAEGLRFANGVNVSPDGARLYVAETAGAALRIYKRDAMTGTLTQERVVRMGAALDNINVDAEGALLIAAHPKPLMAADPEAIAPSLVLRYVDGAKGKPETVFSDDGKEISGSTVAARLDDTLLIGGLNERKFLLCKLPS